MRKLTFFEKLKETRNHKEYRLKCYEAFLDFKEIIKGHKGEYIYLKDKSENIEDEDRYNYIWHASELEFDEVDLHSVQIVSLPNFPKDTINHGWRNVSYFDIMTDYEIFFKDKAEEMMADYNEEYQRDLRDVADKIKVETVYHNKYRSPLSPDYLIKINRLFKCSGTIYVDIEYSQLNGEDKKLLTETLKRNFFSVYEEGDGVEQLKP